MQTMLSEALREFVGLLEQLIRNLLGHDSKEWAYELKRFLRKEPCWASRMMPIPLEWSPDLGFVKLEKVIGVLARYEKETRTEGWRLPSQIELAREIEARENDFVHGCEYWAEMKEHAYQTVRLNFRPNDGMKVTVGTDGPRFINEHKVRLRLCREVPAHDVIALV